jgi:hypothetical protein
MATYVILATFTDQGIKRPKTQRAAGGEGADHRVLGSEHACGREPTVRRFSTAAA